MRFSPWRTQKKIQVFIPKTDLPPALDINLNTEDGQKRFAQNFLTEYFPGYGFYLKQIKDCCLEYNPVLNTIIYEESYVRFEFGSETITVTAIMIDAREEASQKKTAITSVEAILNILPELSAGDVIVGIDFIYYFDLKDEELYKVKNARAFPHWRIITQDGKVIYTPAFRN